MPPEIPVWSMPPVTMCFLLTATIILPTVPCLHWQKPLNGSLRICTSLRFNTSMVRRMHLRNQSVSPCIPPYPCHPIRSCCWSPPVPGSEYAAAVCFWTTAFAFPVGCGMRICAPPPSACITQKPWYFCQTRFISMSSATAPLCTAHPRAGTLRFWMPWRSCTGSFLTSRFLRAFPMCYAISMSTTA